MLCFESFHEAILQVNRTRTFGPVERTFCLKSRRGTTGGRRAQSGPASSGTPLPGFATHPLHTKRSPVCCRSFCRRSFSRTYPCNQSFDVSLELLGETPGGPARPSSRPPHQVTHHYSVWLCWPVLKIVRVCGVFFYIAKFRVQPPCDRTVSYHHFAIPCARCNTTPGRPAAPHGRQEPQIQRDALPGLHVVCDSFCFPRICSPEAVNAGRVC